MAKLITIDLYIDKKDETKYIFITIKNIRGGDLFAKTGSLPHPFLSLPTLPSLPLPPGGTTNPIYPARRCGECCEFRQQV